MLVRLYTAVLHTKYAMYCSHIYKSLERFAINDFLKPFNKCHSQYFLIIYKKTATAKLYILTNYFLSIYNATIQKRDRKKKERKKEGNA